ncbi:two-component sensor [Marinicauda pacifica]|uniref:histidine kinase n=1 Tax=Marinicauda pacifica TaxID=1133559 RepID=A0A4S2H971_9PROT|nr:ATP-binding protein [Marinicauda pacifica]TGY92138.1 response regulator [Marinicauda pacifica]GGE46280.1 two-component sensor [Marinicauda pacifica]
MGLTETLLWCVVYVAVLFAIAAVGEARAAPITRHRALRPAIYAFGLGVYCTSWTFYGAVGEASRNGWDYLPIYLGPALIFGLAHPLVHRMVRLGREHNTASIADFLSARFGKSASVGALASSLLVLASLPYIALQLRSAAASLEILLQRPIEFDAALACAIAFAAFALLFGARRPDLGTGNRGLALAVAVESLVKLVAMLAIGLFAWGLWTQMPEGERAQAPAALALAGSSLDLRFWTLTLLAALAALCLPRQFHMSVVEAGRAGDTRTARWAFPAYLGVVALVALPVALAGTARLPGANPDSLILALPVDAGRDGLALLSFLGGLSASAGMVTIASLALSTMVVNDMLGPLLLRKGHRSSEEGLARRLLTYRRLAIVGVVALAYLFHSGMQAPSGLSSIGLIAFAGAAQLGPALIFGLYWRGASRPGALAGIGVGGLCWVVLILAPAYAGLAPIAPAGVDPFAFAALTSLALNTFAFIAAVAFRRTGLVDYIQADAFIRAENAAQERDPVASGTRVADLELLLMRVLGEEEARASLDSFESALGRELKSGDTLTPALAGLAEARLARSVGAASARVLMTRVVQGARISPDEVVALLDETGEKIRSSRDALEESERSVRFYTDNVPALLSYADRDYRLQFANQAYLDFFAIDRSAIGQPMSAYLGETEFHQRKGFMDAALQGQRQEFDVTHPDARGRDRIWQLVYQPRIENGTVLGFYGVYQDVTARREAEIGLKRAYETLEEKVEARTAALRAESQARLELARDLEIARREAEAATASKTRFLAAASHDLLQPLSAARLLTSALEQEMEAAGDRPRDLARRIDRAIENADQLLRALLDISRLDAGGVTPNLSVFSLGLLIEDTANQFAPRAAAKGVELTSVANRLSVYSDRGLMTSVLQNLVSNAVRYTETGRVLVGARRSADAVTLCVYDTGPGIGEDERERVFREFERGSRSTREDRGLGLGLAIVDRIVKRLGHPIRVQSEVGHGTCFQVVIPRASGRAARTNAGSRRAGASLDGLRVLYVEDDPGVLEAGVDAMRRWGCEVEGVPGGKEAMDAFGGNAPDVAVLDYQLEEDETGPELYERLCLQWGVRPPGLLATAERGAAVRDAAARSALDVLSKPLAPAALRASLAAMKRRAGRGA